MKRRVREEGGIFGRVGRRGGRRGVGGCVWVEIDGGREEGNRRHGH